ncbi:MAG: hypothetical protein LUQ37_07985 [Methanoregulaceae archaeon]|nr:hypothetical protein [Methanoregulaceae archaeon]
MIITSLGTSWLVTMNPAKTGDTAVIDLTIHDTEGRPVLTTDIRVFNASYEKGEIVWYTNPLTMAVNSTSTEMISPLPVYRYDYGEASFGLFGDELNQISATLEGMKQGGAEKIVFANSDVLQREMTPEQFTEMGGNFTMAVPGDQMLLAFTTNPMIDLDDNSTPEYALRTSVITEKTTENVTVNYGYPSADISIVRLNHG